MHPSGDELLALRDGEASPDVVAHASACPLPRGIGAPQTHYPGLRDLPLLKPSSDGWSALKPQITPPTCPIVRQPPGQRS